jgi:fucokinase
VTASNALQAEAYEAQIELRRRHGLLSGVRRALVVTDFEGKRIGSGGATLGALARVLDFDQRGHDPERALRNLRILIVHAGGDSIRLPAYGPCGKIFVPVPVGQAFCLSGTGRMPVLHSPVPPALFDRVVPGLMKLPEGSPGQGQIVVAAGDALMYWDISDLSFERDGITVLGGCATPQEASRHGVYCLAANRSIALYLQKPSEDEQRRFGAIGPSGEAVLDIGVMSMDAAAAAVLLRFLDAARDGHPDFAASAREWIRRGGLDLYREICCAMGSRGSLEHYIRSAQAGGSAWSEPDLAKLYPDLREIPFHARVLPYCRFLHFGSTRQLAESGVTMMDLDGARPTGGPVSVNNVIEAAVSGGPDCWVEGCRISAPLDLAGRNVVVGLDIVEPLSLASETCLEVLDGQDRNGTPVWFTRIYGVRDTFKDPILRGGEFCGRPLLEWISATGLDPDTVWPDHPDPAQRNLWNAHVFPAGDSPADFRRWLWMCAPAAATPAEKQSYRAADRYSPAGIALLTDQRAFHSRRLENWSVAQGR